VLIRSSLVEVLVGLGVESVIAQLSAGVGQQTVAVVVLLEAQVLKILGVAE
jgi:hypothetical protein